MKLLDRRYVYLMKRTPDNKAKMIACRRMFNARKVEKALHDLFAESRFDITRRIRFRKWFQSHVKIGIARRPKSRLRQVNENIFGSGHTEWFAVNGLELILLRAWLFWFSVKAYVIAALIIAIATIYLMYDNHDNNFDFVNNALQR